MSFCPNCQASIASDAAICPSCHAEFSGEGWRPLDDLPPQKSTSAAGIIALLGVASVVLPAIAFLLGLLISTTVPGCQCDTGQGCVGCGANDLVAGLLFGGFVAALFCGMFVLPSSIVLAGLIAMFKKSPGDSKKDR